MVLSYFIGGLVFYFLYLYFPHLSLSFLTIALSLLLKKRNFIALVLLFLGFLYASIRQEEELRPLAEEVSARVIFSDKRVAKEGYRYELLIKDCYTGTCPSRVRLYLQKDILPGTEADVTMKLNLKSPRLVPGLFSKPSYVAVPLEIKIKGSSGAFRWILEKERAELNRLFDRVFSEDGRDLSKALVIGSRDIGHDLRESFRKTGLAHLLTVSGTHFGLLFFLLFNLVKRIVLLMPYRLFHKLTTFTSINFLAGISVLPIMLWYLLLSGMEIPALRAFIMAVSFVLGLMLGRRYYWLTALLWAATLILLIEPASIMDISFLLSFSAVFFIGLWLEYFRRYYSNEGIHRRLLKPITDTLFISMAATAGTTPLVLYLFHYISSTGIIANFIITPFVCFIILPLLILFSVVYLLSGHIILVDLIESLLNLCLKTVESFASFKYTEINVMAFPLIVLPFLYIFLFLFFYEKRYRYLYIMVFLLIISFIALRKDRILQVIFLDVGHADSAVIELPDKKVVVIDTGREGIEVSAYLRYSGINTIDVLVITHSHLDHTGGIGLLKENFRIKEIWDNGLLLYDDSLKTIPRRSLERGDLIRAQEYSFLILHPYRGFNISSDSEYRFENNSSLVMKLIKGEHSVLFAGDIEEEAQVDLLHLGNLLKSTILKVPHHGSRHSANQEFFALVSPDMAIISTGHENPYGYPHEEVLRFLEGSKKYLTSFDGSIKIAFFERPYVKLYNEYRIKRVRSLKDEILNIKNLFRIF